MLPSAEFVFVWDTCGPVTQKNVPFNDRQYPDQRSQGNHLIQSVGVDFYLLCFCVRRTTRRLHECTCLSRSSCCTRSPFLCPSHHVVIRFRNCTYRTCEQRRPRRACASAQPRQSLRCSNIQIMYVDKGIELNPNTWPFSVIFAHAYLNTGQTHI